MASLGHRGRARGGFGRRWGIDRIEGTQSSSPNAKDARIEFSSQARESFVIVVPNQLYSFHYSQVPGFDRIYELARQHSYAPLGVDERHFENLAADHRLFTRRQTLDGLPDEAAILQQEFELSQSTGDRSATRSAPDVETDELRPALASLAPHQPPAAALLPEATAAGRSELLRADVPHRVASGYVKLDDRKTRLADLIAEVSNFFGVACRCQGDYWYPPGGFRDWHTNKFDKSGWRLYIVDVDLPARSYFRIKNPATGEIQTLWDQPGTLNFFLIDPNRLLWHCIGAQRANRWSKGFVIPDTWLDSVAGRLS